MKRTSVLASQKLDDVKVVEGMRGGYCGCRYVLEFTHITTSDRGSQHMSTREVVIRHEVGGTAKQDIEKLLREIRETAADAAAVYLADFAAANVEFNKPNNTDAAEQDADGVRATEHSALPSKISFFRRAELHRFEIHTDGKDYEHDPLESNAVTIDVTEGYRGSMMFTRASAMDLVEFLNEWLQHDGAR